LYLLSLAYAGKGYKRDALKYLRKAINFGYSSKKIKEDLEAKKLRDITGYRLIIEDDEDNEDW
jgi:hypothetical protein